MDHKEDIAVDLATSRVMVEVILTMMETLLEDDAVVVEVVAAGAVMEVMVDVIDWEVMVATMVMILVIIERRLWW
jgi:hypothetical protein